MTAPAVYYGFQWSNSCIQRLWNFGPRGIVDWHARAYELGYRMFLGRFLDSNRPDQAYYGGFNPWQSQIDELMVTLGRWADEQNDMVELVSYMPPDPKPEFASQINKWVDYGWRLGWDRITAQDAPSARFQLSYDPSAGDPWNLIEPWPGGEWHRDFYRHRCVCTYDQYQRRLEDGKRPDDGAMPDTYVLPDERWAAQWSNVNATNPHPIDPASKAYAVESLRQFCVTIASDDRPDARRLPMLPIDVVVAHGFDARPYNKAYVIQQEAQKQMTVPPPTGSA